MSEGIFLDDDQFRELAVFAIDGNEEAENRLFVFFRAPLQAYIFRKVRGAHLVDIDHEDILQETLFSAHLALPDHEPKSSEAFFCWLKKIAKNRYIDALRKINSQKRGGNFHQVSNSSRSSNYDSQSLSLYEAATSDQPTPSHVMSEAERISATVNRLEDIKTRYRQVLILKYFQQLTVSEIAERLQITEGMAKRRLEDGRNEMFRRLNGKV